MLLPPRLKAEEKSCILNLNPDFVELTTSINPLKHIENESWCFVFFWRDYSSFWGCCKPEKVSQLEARGRGAMEYPERQPGGSLSGIRDQY